VCVCSVCLKLAQHTHNGQIRAHTHTHTLVTMYRPGSLKCWAWKLSFRASKGKEVLLFFCAYVMNDASFAPFCYSDSGPGSPDSNYLRVAQSLAGRRLSDNTNSGNRGRPAPSSSIHLSPATCLSVGSLPTRRHSSIGSTDRRPSTANLLPPSVI
jgi:hypothetical protein